MYVPNLSNSKQVSISITKLTYFRKTVKIKPNS